MLWSRGIFSPAPTPAPAPDPNFGSGSDSGSGSGSRPNLVSRMKFVKVVFEESEFATFFREFTKSLREFATFARYVTESRKL